MWMRMGMWIAIVVQMMLYLYVYTRNVHKHFFQPLHLRVTLNGRFHTSVNTVNLFEPIFYFSHFFAPFFNMVIWSATDLPRKKYSQCAFRSKNEHNKKFENAKYVYVGTWFLCSHSFRLLHQIFLTQHSRFSFLPTFFLLLLVLFHSDEMTQYTYFKLFALIVHFKSICCW